MTGQRIAGFWFSFSSAGLILGTLFFAASQTPSLLPRTYLTQGILSGVSLAAGYGLGVFLQFLWTYLELPVPKAQIARRLKMIAAPVSAVVVLAFLWQAAAWQNSIRALMHMEPVETAHPVYVGLIASAAFALLLAVGRLFRIVAGAIARHLRRVVPRRLSYVAGVFLAATVFWMAADGILFRLALHAADSSFKALDQAMEPDSERPADPGKTGSAASLVSWEDLGRTGRAFVSGGSSAADISAFTGQEAREPIRVYAGLNSAESAGERARLALEELKRAGGFGRSVLIVVMPTGTGWIDPEAMDTLEYLHHGDVASVALQYSYLTSWLSLIVEPDYGEEAATSLFKEIYGHWTTLPKDARPRLYLYGLSLGALASEQSTELFEVLGDPHQGALWAGPPFQSRIWRAMTRDRNPGTPAWLPRVRDGTYVRFTSQENALPEAGSRWGPMRIVYLQYASDPVTFFDVYSFYRQPDWMRTPRGPDVSPDFRWYPIVTFLQLALDMAMATTSPMGFGHVYAGEHYIDAWLAVTEPPGWTPDGIARLKERFRSGR
ncbi:MAG: alpha/beta-hydrolase family protein [Shinella sp.]|nr:alpha/beta-hydrolase family protein [Shinella sp.]